MTYREALAEATNQLKYADITDFEFDSWAMFEAVTGMTKSSFLVNRDDDIPKDKLSIYKSMIEQRVSHRPLQYIIGTAWFYGLEFDVDENVLIPRFDTENLVEWILKDEKDANSFLDMCTGSGCIAVACSYYLKSIRGVASDISEGALLVAEKNAKKHGCDIAFKKGNLFESIEGKFDFIVSNPPYIEPEVVEKLSSEVKDFEPRLALTDEEDGLLFYRKISKEAKSFLKAGGRLYFEIGYNQAEAVTDILTAEGYDDIMVKKDLSGLDRCIKAVYKHQGE